MTTQNEPAGYCEHCGTIPPVPWKHDADCLAWAPPPRGPGSTEQGRRAALEQIRATLNARKETR